MKELAQSQAFMNKQKLNLFRGTTPHYTETCFNFTKLDLFMLL